MRLNSFNKGLTMVASATPLVFSARSTPTVTCCGIQSVSKKLRTMQKVSCVPRLIHSSNVTLTVIHFPTNGSTYCSIVFMNIAGICSFTNCLLEGKAILESHMSTRRRTHGLSIRDKGMQPLAMSNTKFVLKLTYGGSSFLYSSLLPKKLII
jgi:hypothetical protein